MSECQYYFQCSNNTKCYRCSDNSLFKQPKNSRNRATSSSKNKILARSNSDKESDESWKLLEQDVADALNNVPNIQQVRRSRGSGNQWFEKGDVVGDILVLPECKERKGNTLKSGTTSMSIQKEWLKKADNEARENGRVMINPFRFKGDDEIYVNMKFDDLVEMLNNYKAYIIEFDKIEAENKVLKERLDAK